MLWEVIKLLTSRLSRESQGIRRLSSSYHFFSFYIFHVCWLTQHKTASSSSSGGGNDDNI